MTDLPSCDALVLAGGRARRLGGVAKPTLTVGGSRLIDRVLTAADAAHLRIVVGPDPRSPMADVVTTEEPAGGGPVAALAAGLSHVDCAVVVLLAGDLPFVTAETVERLRAALATPSRTDLGAPDSAVLVDGSGHDQYLIAAWQTARLREIIARREHPGGSMRAVFGCAAAPVRVPGEHAKGAPPPWLDCDTEDDLARARRWT